jgi:hypothetical protein
VFVDCKLTLCVDFKREHHKEKVMAKVAVSVGHTVTNVIQYFDQNGNPMVTTPTPDSPPAWTDTGSAMSPPIDTLSVSTDGNTATVTPSAAGTDNLSVVVVVGGASFNASVEIDISAAAQVLTSIGIASTVA